MKEKTRLHSRSKARMRAMQAIYQHHMNATAPEDLLAEYGTSTGRVKNADKHYFKQIVLGTLQHRADLDDHLEPLLDRKLIELDAVERAILELGAYELLHEANTPWKTIINDAVDLAKQFGGEKSHSYINAVLDKLAQRVRAPTEEEHGTPPD
ncbi:MAG: transcription antitermination factor NusB [Candidatus Eutrophobiaceae bacterium]